MYHGTVTGQISMDGDNLELHSGAVGSSVALKGLNPDLSAEQAGLSACLVTRDWYMQMISKVVSCWWFLPLILMACFSILLVRLQHLFNHN